MLIYGMGASLDSGIRIMDLAPLSFETKIFPKLNTFDISLVETNPPIQIYEWTTFLSSYKNILKPEILNLSWSESDIYKNAEQ